MIAFPATKPEVCPLCGGDWIVQPRTSEFYDDFLCRDLGFKLMVIINKISKHHLDFGFHKRLGQATIIWWSNMPNQTQIRRYKNNYQDWDTEWVDWYLPLNFSEQQLKLWTIMK